MKKMMMSISLLHRFDPRSIRMLVMFGILLLVVGTVGMTVTHGFDIQQANSQRHQLNDKATRVRREIKAQQKKHN